MMSSSSSLWFCFAAFRCETQSIVIFFYIYSEFTSSRPGKDRNCRLNCDSQHAFQRETVFLKLNGQLSMGYVNLNSKFRCKCNAVSLVLFVVSQFTLMYLKTWRSVSWCLSDRKYEDEALAKLSVTYRKC